MKSWVSSQLSLDECEHKKLAVHFQYYELEDYGFDAEHFCSGFLLKKGWKVYFTKDCASFKKIKKKLIDCDHSLNYLNPKFQKYIFSAMQDRLGRPDLICFKDGRIMFVEVKTGSDGLRGEQIRWMIKHESEWYDLMVFYVGCKHSTRKKLMEKNNE